MASAESAALFLFAHQDDEFGVFQKIIDEHKNGQRVYCAYLTDGGFGGVSPQLRNQESLAVLSQLWVNEQDVFFAGHELSVPDGYLPEYLAVSANWLCEWLSGFTHISAIYVPAWEGGHQDHDALHALTVSIARELGILKCVRQFPLYNGNHCPGPLFKVLSPLLRNGTIDHKKIPWKNRLRFLHYCLSYPSQATAWLGLFPFVMLHYLLKGFQMLQPVASERILQRPHDGKLYYEKRGFFTWEKMCCCITLWQTSRLSDKQLEI